MQAGVALASDVLKVMTLVPVWQLPHRLVMRLNRSPADFTPIFFQSIPRARPTF
jgi:hypothetical protein